MKQIYNTEQIRNWIDEYHILDNFDTPNLVFQAFKFEKGEYITKQNSRLNRLYFLIEGTIQIYGVRKDGSISPVNQISGLTVIGDLEYYGQGICPFFTEAKTGYIFISLSTKSYRVLLDTDVKFLHMLLRSYADKMRNFLEMDSFASSLEERVLLYIRNFCPSYELIGIEKSVLQLRCSRRQLQRVLKKLCGENRLMKTGKGKYRLIDISGSNP